MIYGQPGCLRLFLSFLVHLLLDRRRAVMRVVVSIDPMEPTEKPFAAPLRWWRRLRWLRSPTILVPSFVPTAVSALVLIGGCRYIVDLTV
jgi:hypothetical protein